MSSSSRADAELSTRVRQQEVVKELGQQALRENDLDRLMRDAAAAVAETLDTEFCTVLELSSGGDEVFLREGVGCREELVGSATVPIDRDSRVRYVLLSEEPVVVEDRRTETRFSESALLTNQDVVSGISVVVGSVDDPWGVLEAHSTERREFTGQDADFVKSVANVLAAAIENERTQRRLQVEETLKERIVETSPVGITVIDDAGEIQFANERAQEILGRSRTELGGMSYDDPEWDVVDADGEPMTGDGGPFERVMTIEEPIYDVELGVRRPDGERVWLSINGAPLHADGGDATEAVFVLEDVTERRRLESELETVFGRITDAFYALDEEFRFTLVNERAEELLQHSEGELLGETLWEVFPEAAEREAVWESFHAAMETQEPQSYELYFEPLDFWVEATVYPSESGVSVYFRDATERVERERELQKSESRYRTIAEHIPNGAVVMFDDDLRYTLASGQAYDDLPLSSEDLVGQRPRDVFEEDLATALESIYRATLDGEDQSIEREYAGRVWRIQVAPIREDDGTISGGASIIQDVTERKRSQRKLEESERRYRTLVEHFPNGAVGLYDEDLRYTAVGGELLEATGITPEDRLGNDVREVYPDDLVEEIEPYFHTALDGEENAFEVEYNDKYLHAYTLPVRNADDEVMAGMLVVQDVTERKEREQELERYETIVEAVNDGVYVVDADSNLLMVNETYAEMVGYSREELIGSNATMVVDEEVIEQVNDLQAASDGNRGERPTVEAELQTASGDEVPVEATFASLPGDDDSGWHRVGVVRDITERKERERALEKSERRYRTLAEHFPNGAVGVYDHDLRFTLAEGAILGDSLPASDRIEGKTVGEVFPAETIADLEPLVRAAVDEGETGSTTTRFGDHVWRVWATPLRDADGEIFAGLSFAQDITDQVEREEKLEELVGKLEESNERLEQFAYAASHDLQEPLRMVSSYLQLIERRYGDELDADGQEFIDFAVDGADRMREMIDGLLEYSRVDTRGNPFEPVELDAVLAAVRENLQVKIEESDAEITAEPLPRVDGDAGQLRQVFQNLLSNAIEYSGDERPRIHVSATRDGDAWRISVRDEGIGIDPADADRVFEVFQSLHDRTEGAGTGIGLALCERIVERHGGDIWVESEPGEGTTFSFTLPVAGDADE